MLGAALATMFAALIGSLGSRSDRDTTDNNVVIASVILLNGVCKLGVASQCWIIGSEIGGTQMRKRMIAWATIIDVLAAFLVTFCTPYLQAGPQIQLGAKVGYIFMALAAIAVFFFFAFVPELKGRSLEEVDELYEVSLQHQTPIDLLADLVSVVCGRGSFRRPRPRVLVISLLNWRQTMSRILTLAPRRR
jgi:hypothetical protein